MEERKPVPEGWEEYRVEFYFWRKEKLSPEAIEKIAGVFGSVVDQLGIGNPVQFDIEYMERDDES